jgi:hypothetical protein
MVHPMKSHQIILGLLWDGFPVQLVMNLRLPVATSNLSAGFRQKKSKTVSAIWAHHPTTMAIIGEGVQQLGHLQKKRVTNYEDVQQVADRQKKMARIYEEVQQLVHLQKKRATTYAEGQRADHRQKKRVGVYEQVQQSVRHLKTARADEEDNVVYLLKTAIIYEEGQLVHRWRTNPVIFPFALAVSSRLGTMRNPNSASPDDLGHGEEVDRWRTTIQLEAAHFSCTAGLGQNRVWAGE